MLLTYLNYYIIYCFAPEGIFVFFDHHLQSVLLAINLPLRVSLRVNPYLMAVGLPVDQC